MILELYESKLKVRKSHKIWQKSNMKLLFNFSVEILLEKRYPTLRGFGLMRNFCSVNFWKQHQRQSMFFKCWLTFLTKPNWVRVGLLGYALMVLQPWLVQTLDWFPWQSKKNPAIQGTHCMIHKAAFVSKIIPKRLHKRMSVVVKVVNYVKSSALNTRLFNKLCKDMNADHTALLYQTQVRWLSKGNMLSRIFDLREKVKLFFSWFSTFSTYSMH